MEYYVWVLPVQVKNTYFHVTISQGMPLTEDETVLTVLTEEQKEQIREDTGKWIPVETEQLDEDKTAERIEQQIADAVGKEKINQALIMGGSPKLRSAVAVVETIDRDIQIVALEEPRSNGVQVIEEQTDIDSESSSENTMTWLMLVAAGIGIGCYAWNRARCK